MNRNTKLLAAGVALAAVTAVAATSATWMPSAEAQGAREHKMAMFGGHHGKGRGMGGMNRLCSDMRGERMERMIGFVESFMTFTAPQQQAWTTLTASVREGNAMVGATCDDLKGDRGKDLAAPERLARMETMMSTGLAVVQKVRPAFDGFYATLSEKQQQALDDMLQHRGRRR